jgi:hypothetical protein
MTADVPVPRFEGLEHLLALSGVDWNQLPWRIGPEEAGKYAELFTSLPLTDTGHVTST